jgi:predicted transcriptional regulator
MSEPKPLIQIDDTIREMTDEEYAAYLALIADSPVLPSAE